MTVSKQNAFLTALITLVAGVAASSLHAYTWTGGGNDGLWTTPANWGETSGYPQNANDPVIFNGSATVSLNTGVQTDIAYIKVSSGNVVLTATEGSSLKINWPGYNNPSGITGDRGITVEEGSSLDIAVPLAEFSGRFDRLGTGKLTIRDITVSKKDSVSWYVFNGTNEFVGTAFVNQPNADFTVGLGTPHDKSFVFIKDSARITSRLFSTSAGGNPVPNTKVVQDGAGTVVSVSGRLDLRNNSGNDGHCYTLKSGTLSASELQISPNSNAAANYAPEHLHYIQEGGTSTFTTVTLTKGSAALRGGVMNIPSLNDITTEGGCKLNLEGGTLALSSGTLSGWDWSSAKFKITPGASSVAIVGTSSLAIPRDCSTYDIGLEIGAGKTVAPAAGATVSSPLGSTNDWKVALNNGSILNLVDTSRVVAPLDLTVTGTGKVNFPGYRGAVVAHRLTVDGVEKAKGRYKTTETFVDGAGGSSILVPTVWTGAGGDNLWSNPANWDDNTVPNGTTAIADVSGATTITLDQDVNLNALIAIPNGVGRKTTISGNGTYIKLYSTENYQCNLFVAKGGELVLDVDLKRDSNNRLYCMCGGGRLSLKKGIPGCNGGNGMWPYLAIDGTMAIVGANASINDGTYLFLGFMSNSGDKNRVLFEDGTTFRAARLWTGTAGYALPYEFRQTGGDITLETFYMNCGGSAGDGRPFYYLDGGSLTVKNSSGYQMINLNRPLSGESGEASAGTWDGRKRYPGGSFEMSGGTLSCKGFNGCYNQNFVRLYGGDVYLYGDSSAEFTYPSSIQGTNRNDYTFYIGGVTIHPKDADRTISSGNVWLTGKNGDVTFDISERQMTIAKGNSIAGPGGFVVTGSDASKTFFACGTYTNTGSVVVRGSAQVRFCDCTLDGPSKVVVESASAKVWLWSPVGQSSNPCTISRPFDVISLAAKSCLSVGGAQTVTVKRLVVGGEDIPAGSYTGSDWFGGGTVVVTGSAPSSWLDGTVGDLSWEANGTTTTVDAETTLSSLTYDPATAGETNTLDGAALTFADGANIHVEKGDTLVIDNAVVFAGKITKTGWGEVVFNGAVTSAVTPAADTDNYWLTVTEGGATFDGAVTGVRLMTCGAIDANDPPVITLKANCTVSNYGIVLTAWNEANVACRGETHQEGATVNYSTEIFDSLIDSRSTWAMTLPRDGGFGRYVLDSGELLGHNGFHLSFLPNASMYGEFEFVQNGGTFIAPKNFMFTRRNNGVKTSYTLNDGRFEIGGTIGGVTDASKNSMSLNGGTYVANASDTIMREAFAFSMSGTVTFDVASGKTLTLANDGTDAVSIIKTGAGSLTLDGMFDLDGLDVQGGTVTLTDKTRPALSGSADLSMARTAKLNLDYAGEAAFKTLTVGGLERGAGVYSVTKGPPAVKNVLSGTGALRIMEGVGLGSVIVIR